MVEQGTESIGWNGAGNDFVLGGSFLVWWHREKNFAHAVPFAVPAAVQLLFNFGVLLTQKLAARTAAAAAP
jgi:hypothetical protein